MADPGERELGLDGDLGEDGVALRSLEVSDSSVELQEFSEDSLGSDPELGPSLGKASASSVWGNLFGLDDYSRISSMKDEPFSVRAMAVLRFNVSLSWVTLCCTVLSCAVVAGVFVVVSPSLFTFV
jgi:hypothetical protein